MVTGPSVVCFVCVGGAAGVVFIFSFVYLPLIKCVMRKNERFFIEIFNKNFTREEVI